MTEVYCHCIVDSRGDLLDGSRNFSFPPNTRPQFLGLHGLYVVPYLPELILCLVLSRLSLLPFLIKIILPVMCDFDHIYTCLSEDICRYVSKDTNFQFIKCNTHVGISIYTFAFSIHFFDIFWGNSAFSLTPTITCPVHEFGTP